MFDGLRPGTVTVIGIPYDENSSFMRGPALASARIREVLHSGSVNLFLREELIWAQSPVSVTWATWNWLVARLRWSKSRPLSGRELMDEAFKKAVPITGRLCFRSHPNSSATQPMANSSNLALRGTPVAGSQPIIS
jgi:hypothetical protein